MRTLLSALALLTAAIGPTAAQGQTFTPQTWTCTATTGEVSVHRIGPGEIRDWIQQFNVFSANWCEPARGGACSYSNGKVQASFEDGLGTFTLDLNTGAFVKDDIGGYSTGTCRVTG